MRKLIIILFLLILLIKMLTACTHRGKVTDDIKIAEYESGFSFVTPITDEERKIVAQVSEAVRSARMNGTLNCKDYRFPLPVPIYLIRDRTQPIPKVCGRPWQCTTDYDSLCALATNSANCQYGFNGLALENLIFILREGKVCEPLSKFRWLMTHEGLHKICNVHHGDQMDIWQKAIEIELPTMLEPRMRVFSNPSATDIVRDNCGGMHQ